MGEGRETTEGEKTNELLELIRLKATVRILRYLYEHGDTPYMELLKVTSTCTLTMRLRSLRRLGFDMDVYKGHEGCAKNVKNQNRASKHPNCKLYNVYAHSWFCMHCMHTVRFQKMHEISKSCIYDAQWRKNNVLNP